MKAAVYHGPRDIRVEAESVGPTCICTVRKLHHISQDALFL